MISFLSSGYSRPDPELSVVPCQSSVTEGDWCYSTIGKSAAEGSPGHPETCLLGTADVPGLETHTQSPEYQLTPQGDIHIAVFKSILLLAWRSVIFHTEEFPRQHQAKSKHLLLFSIICNLDSPFSSTERKLSLPAVVVPVHLK